MPTPQLLALDRRFKRVIRQVRPYLTAPVFILTYFLMWVLWPGRSIRIVVMDPRYFGHQCLEPEVFWNDWKSDQESGSRNIWLCSLGKKSMASNRYLWELTRKRLHTVPSWIVSDIKSIKERLGFKKIQLLDASIYRLNFLSTRSCSLPSGQSLSHRLDEILTRLHEPQRPYVVYTIRDPRVSYDPSDPRNREIHEFLPSMLSLTDHGYNVIRLTSRTTDMICSQSPHILDWQTQICGEPGDELPILSGASFVVSSTTGGDCLALAYRKPVLYMDSARFYLAFLGTEYATLHVPEMFDVATGERLSISAILERGLGWRGDYKSFVRAGVQIRNSDSDEIVSAVSEFESSVSVTTRRSDDSYQHYWRQLLMGYHGHEIIPRHGEIRARMLSSSIHSFATPSDKDRREIGPN